MKKLIAAGIGIFALFLIIYISGIFDDQVQAGNESEEFEYEYYYNDSDSGDDSLSDTNTANTYDNAIEGITADTAAAESGSSDSQPEIDTENDSITVFVNKEYSLPSTFIPKDLIIPDIKFLSNGPEEKRYMRDIAASALEKMFSDAADDGETLYGVSGYRSYTRQTEIYNKNVRQRGSAVTNQVSAIPGHSEHQTGLAIDISCSDLKGALSARFAETTEGQWIADNCYRYGFIVRYPQNCESLTGYTYEPWHIRYVGTDVAKYIFDNNITLEEYFNYTPDENLIKQITSDAATAEKVSSYEPETAATKEPEDNSTDEDKKKESKHKKNKQGKQTSNPAPDNTPETDNSADNSADAPAATSEPAKAAPPAQPQSTQPPAPTDVPVVTSVPTDVLLPTYAPAPTDVPASTNAPADSPDSNPVSPANE